MIRSRTLITASIAGLLVLAGTMPTTAMAEGTTTASSGAGCTASCRFPTFDAPPLYSIAGTETEAVGIDSMVAGDFTGKGSTDIATAPYGGAAPGATSKTGVLVFRGAGNGTFQAPVQYPAGLYPAKIVAARLRGPNAPLDLIVGDDGQTPAGQFTVAVLLGNGNGTFQAPKLFSIPGQPVGMAVGDFNGDGKPDLAVSTGSPTTAPPEELTVLLGKGDGTLGPATSYPAGDGTSVFYDMTIGDFNNDGNLDLLGMDPSGLWLSLGNGDGTFKPAALVWADPTTFLVSPTIDGPTSVTTGDFNRDGNLDVALDIQGQRVDVLLGTGAGAFAPALTYQITGNQNGNGDGQIRAAALRGDGILDLVVSTGFGGTLVVLPGNGDGTFQSPVTYPLPETDDAAIVVADVNHDGKPDVVTGTMLSTLAGGINYLTVLLNQGNGTFLQPRQFSIVAPYDNSNVDATNAVGIALGHFTHSRHTDLVVTDFDLPLEPAANGSVPPIPTINLNNDTVDSGGTISVLLGSGDGTFQAETQYRVGGRPIAAATGDLTGNGSQDIVVANASSNTLSILKGNGDGTFQAAITIPVGTNPNALAIADLNHDGKPDIAITDLLDGTVSILINASTPGQISFRAPTAVKVGDYPSGVVIGDFNHDGKPDLAVLNDGDPYSGQSTPSTLSILLGKGDGTFQPARTQQLWSTTGADALAAGSFVAPGSLDLAVANFSLGQVMILQGSRTGAFTPAGVYTVGNGPESIGVGDFNGDGHPDLAVDDINDNSIAILLGKGRGQFVAAANRASAQPLPFGVPAFAYPAFLAVGPLTASCRADIVATNIFAETVTVLKNTTPSAAKSSTC